MAELNQLVFKESAYGCFDEMQDVVENWTKENKEQAKIKRGEYGHIQEILDGVLVNTRTITLWCEGDAALPSVSPAECEHGNTEVQATTETCTKEGSIVTICKDCYKTVSREIIPATGHTLETSEEDGILVTKCTTCGHVTRVVPFPIDEEEDTEKED